MDGGDLLGERSVIEMPPMLILLQLCGVVGAIADTFSTRD